MTEPEARPVKGVGSSYNVQSAVDADHHLMVYHEVTDEVTDNRSLEPMARSAKQVTEPSSMNVLADAGYANGEQLASLESAGITPYVAPNRAVNTQGNGTLFGTEQFEYESQKDAYRCPAGKVLTRKQQNRKKKYVLYSARASDCGVCPLQSQYTMSQQHYVTRHVYEEALQRTAKRTTAAHMRWRGAMVEHPFGTLKYQVFEKPRFLMKGKEGAGTEMALGVLAYNLKRVINVLGNTKLREQLLTG